MKKVNTFSLCIIALLIIGFTGILNAQNKSNSIKSETLLFQGDERDYIIYLPASYNTNKKYPLVLNFHGYGSNAKEQMGYTKFNDLADKEEFVVVYPNGTLLENKTHWNVGGWTLASKTDDVGFINSLIDKLIENFSIDNDRIYAIGMSNGGYMSFLLACQLSSKVAAIASVTGSMTPQTFNKCKPTHAMPVLQLHGDTDPTVPYDGNQLWTKSIEDVIDYLTTFNGIEGDPKILDIPNSESNDGFTVKSFSYNNRDNGVEVIHYKVINGKHEWFGAMQKADIDTSEIIWDFLSNYDIHGKID